VKTKEQAVGRSVKTRSHSFRFDMTLQTPLCKNNAAQRCHNQARLPCDCAYATDRQSLNWAKPPIFMAVGNAHCPYCPSSVYYFHFTFCSAIKMCYTRTRTLLFRYKSNVKRPHIDLQAHRFDSTDICSPSAVWKVWWKIQDRIELFFCVVLAFLRGRGQKAAPAVNWNSSPRFMATFTAKPERPGCLFRLTRPLMTDGWLNGPQFAD